MIHHTPATQKQSKLTCFLTCFHPKCKACIKNTRRFWSRHSSHLAMMLYKPFTPFYLFLLRSIKLYFNAHWVIYKPFALCSTHAIKRIFNANCTMYINNDRLIATMQTWIERDGSFCLNVRSHTSTVPSILHVKNTAGLTGLQHPSVRYDWWYLVKQKTIQMQCGTLLHDYFHMCSRLMVYFTYQMCVFGSHTEKSLVVQFLLCPHYRRLSNVFGPDLNICQH